MTSKNLWQFIWVFFASPWGIILPMSGIVLLLMSGAMTSILERDASLFWRQLDSLEPSEVNAALTNCGEQGKLSLSILVTGLADRREVVHRFCRDQLLTAVGTAGTSQQPDTATLRLYSRLTKLLLDLPDNAGTIHSQAAAEIARTILEQLATLPPSTASDLAEINAGCIDLIDRVDQAVDPKSPARGPWETLTASRGGPPNTVGETATEMIAATRRARSGIPQHPYSAFDEPAPETMVAMRDTKMRDTNTLIAQQNIAVPAIPALQSDAPQQKIASAFSPTKLTPPLRPVSTLLEPVENTPLGQRAVDEFGTCSSAELMRLLHHPNGTTRQQAAQLLVSRDGFTPELMRLAHRLYHPERAVRLELVSQLPGVLGAGSLFWWDALAQDPHPDVRYAALSFLATLQDPQVRHRVVAITAADADPRISSIGTKLR